MGGTPYTDGNAIIEASSITFLLEVGYPTSSEEGTILFASG